jgi:hypothetical protein
MRMLRRICTVGEESGPHYYYFHLSLCGERRMMNVRLWRNLLGEDEPDM